MVHRTRGTRFSGRTRPSCTGVSGKVVIAVAAKTQQAQRDVLDDRYEGYQLDAPEGHSAKERRFPQPQHREYTCRYGMGYHAVIVSSNTQSVMKVSQRDIFAQLLTCLCGNEPLAVSNQQVTAHPP